MNETKKPTEQARRINTVIRTRNPRRDQNPNDPQNRQTEPESRDQSHEPGYEQGRRERISSLPVNLHDSEDVLHHGAYQRSRTRYRSAVDKDSRKNPGGPYEPCVRIAVSLGFLTSDVDTNSSLLSHGDLRIRYAAKAKAATSHRRATAVVMLEADEWRLEKSGISRTCRA